MFGSMLQENNKMIESVMPGYDSIGLEDMSLEYLYKEFGGLLDDIFEPEPMLPFLTDLKSPFCTSPLPEAVLPDVKSPSCTSPLPESMLPESPSCTSPLSQSIFNDVLDLDSPQRTADFLLVSPVTQNPVDLFVPLDIMDPSEVCLDTDLLNLESDDSESYRGTHSVTTVGKNFTWDFLEPVHNDHSYSVPPDKVEIKCEVVDDEDSTGSSEPDVETMPICEADYDMPIKQEPKPQAVPKSTGKNMKLLQPPACTRKRRGRKPKNAPPAKRAKVGRPRTVKNACTTFSVRQLEGGARKLSCKKNTRKRKKIGNSVETMLFTYNTIDSCASSPSSIHSMFDSDDSLSVDHKNDSEKRASHNLAERQRRQELSTLFENLRNKIPNLGGEHHKASKVRILKEATFAAYAYKEQTQSRKNILIKDFTRDVNKKLKLLIYLRDIAGDTEVK